MVSRYSPIGSHWTVRFLPHLGGAEDLGKTNAAKMVTNSAFIVNKKEGILHSGSVCRSNGVI